MIKTWVKVFFIGLFLMINSCCDKDQICEAGSYDLGIFPYKYGSTINFGDGDGKKVEVVFPNIPELSEPYEVKGKCSLPRKQENCSSNISMKATVIDSFNIFEDREKYFILGFEKQDEVGRPSTNYNLSAFGFVQMGGNYSNDSIDFSYLYKEEIKNYKTPFRDYPIVYMSKLPVTFGSRKFFFSPNGRLVSFNLAKDTSHFFYEME